MGSWGGWAAESRLRLFELTIYVSKKCQLQARHAQRAKEMSHYHHIQTHAFYVVPSVGSVVSVVNLHGQKNSL